MTTHQQQLSETNQQVLAQITDFTAKYGAGYDLRVVEPMMVSAIDSLNRQREQHLRRLRNIGTIANSHLLEGHDRTLFNMTAISAQNNRNEVARRLIDRGIEVTELLDGNVTSTRGEFMGHVFGFHVDLASVNYWTLHGIQMQPWESPKNQPKTNG